MRMPCTCASPTRACALARRLPATAISISRRCWPPAKSPAPTRCIPVTAFSRRMHALPKYSPSTTFISSGRSRRIFDSWATRSKPGARRNDWACRWCRGPMAACPPMRMEYLGVGTVEFLYADGKFHFIEMNTRIQVEHPVTEMITDIDLVLEQIRVAAGGELDLSQRDVRFNGHAIECRINAENPVSFRPSPGKIVHYHPPGGLGVRVDSAVYHGYSIPPYYDSLVGKLIVHGKTRGECLMRLKRALDEFVIEGIETTLPLFRALVREKDVIDGDYHIHWLEAFLARGGMQA